MVWPERFLTAISTGADLYLVSAHFMVWLLETELEHWPSKESRVVVALYRRRINGDEPTLEEWYQVGWAAAEAAWWASGAWAWASWAVRGAAWAVRSGVGAAWATEYAARARVPDSYIRMANKLIELLEAAK